MGFLSNLFSCFAAPAESHRPGVNVLDAVTPSQANKAELRSVASPNVVDSVPSQAELLSPSDSCRPYIFCKDQDYVTVTGASCRGACAAVLPCVALRSRTCSAVCIFYERGRLVVSSKAAAV